jgi:hypothetical protein
MFDASDRPDRPASSRDRPGLQSERYGRVDPLRERDRRQALALPILLAVKRVRISLGPYPEIGLKEARELRDGVLTLVAQGTDPREY